MIDLINKIHMHVQFLNETMMEKWKNANDQMEWHGDASFNKQDIKWIPTFFS